MNIDLQCPSCKHEFEVKEWEDGECPICFNDFYFDESCTEDYSDCWTSVYWGRYTCQ